MKSISQRKLYEEQNELKKRVEDIKKFKEEQLHMKKQSQEEIALWLELQKEDKKIQEFNEQKFLNYKERGINKTLLPK